MLPSLHKDDPPIPPKPIAGWSSAALLFGGNSQATAALAKTQRDCVFRPDKSTAEETYRETVHFILSPGRHCPYFSGGAPAGYLVFVRRFSDSNTTLLKRNAKHHDMKNTKWGWTPAWSASRGWAPVVMPQRGSGNGRRTLRGTKFNDVLLVQGGLMGMLEKPQYFFRL